MSLHQMKAISLEKVKAKRSDLSAFSTAGGGIIHRRCAALLHGRITGAWSSRMYEARQGNKKAANGNWLEVREFMTW